MAGPPGGTREGDSWTQAPAPPSRSSPSSKAAACMPGRQVVEPGKGVTEGLGAALAKVISVREQTPGEQSRAEPRGCGWSKREQ